MWLTQSRGTIEIHGGEYLKKIAVCICTFKRSDMLAKLIKSVIKARQLFAEKSPEKYEIEIFVVDNDSEKSAENEISNFTQKYSFIHYYCEEKKGLVMARNTCLKIAIENDFNYLAFIDDDEYVDESWLYNLMNTLQSYKANIVFGRVIPIFPQGTEEWIQKGGFFRKYNYETGTMGVISATANVLFELDMVRKENEYFHVAFNKTGGEDTYFFKKYLKSGYKSVWDNEAIVFDRIIKTRLNEKYIYLRAYTSSYTYSEIKQKLNEENQILCLLKGIIKTLMNSIIYIFNLFMSKEKKVRIKRNIYSGVGRMKIKKISRY